MTWLQVMRSTPLGNSGYDAFQYTDAGGTAYARTYSTQGATDASEAVASHIGYVSAAAGAWYAGKRATLYDLAGNVTGSFEIKDPNARDWGGMIALAFIAAVTGGAALSALGGAGTASLAGNTGYGIVGGATEPVASLALGGGTAATVAGTAAVTVAGTGATVAGVAGTVASVAGTVAKLAGAAAAVLGLAPAGTDAAPLQPGTAPPPGAGAGVSPLTMLVGLGLAVLALKG